MRATRPTIQRLTSGLAVLALGAALTACGGSGESDAADDPAPAGSSSSTSTEPSETTSTEEASPIDDGGEVAVADFVARIQNGIKNTKYAHIVFSLSGGTGGMEGQGDTDYTVTPANMKMTMSIAGRDMNLLLVDGVMYIESAQAPGKFLKYDLSDPSNPLGSQLTGQLDPAASMAKFAAAVSTVTSLGEEDLAGQSADHYVMSIDTSQLATASPVAGMPDELKADVWLDGDDRMVKSSIDVGSGATYDATLSDFDKPVEITAPPADQVVVAPES
jgi:hypothetical protein